MTADPDPKAVWPKYLLVPSKYQFEHGSYIRFDHSQTKSDDDSDAMFDANSHAKSGVMDDQEREALKYHCGTSCCFVGWAALAFGEPGVEPEEIANPATVEFLNKFIEFAGRDIVHRESNGYIEDFSKFSKRVGHAASDVFEGTDEHGKYALPRLSPSRARNLWKKTGDHFGYDMKNLLDE